MSLAGQHDQVLEELKERWSYGTTEWKEIRAEGAKNMKYVAGNPWAEKDRKEREDAGRVCLSSDELGQYTNQVINDFRSNKRGIKVSPTGNGANDRTAQFRQGKIRDIEYRSNAQQAYTIGGENAIQRGYGYWRIKPRYVHQSKGFDQELTIEPVVNPDMVTPDPDFLRPDGTDWKWLFYEETRTEKEFKREWPDAKVKSFGPEQVKLSGDWITATRVRIAEYWEKKVAGRRTLLLVKPPNDQGEPLEIFEDEYKQAFGELKSDHILKHRKVDQLKVCQYITNGLEILEDNDFPEESIPFVGCYGKILYLDEGGGPKRKILSMITLARDPYMLYCYYRTQQAEMAGMIPKVPVIGYKGQFAGLENEWQRAPHEPLAYLEINAKTADTGEQILPLPTRLAYEAGTHLQALELCAEGARRAIQAAMGTSPLPTSAQRHNEKSGKALQQMEESGQKGSFHFTDSYDGGVTRTGTILSALIKHYYDTARETSIRLPDDKPSMVRINDPQALYNSKLEKHDGHGSTDGHGPIMVDEGDHDVTISVGPAMESERDAASQFADAIVGSKEIMMVAGPTKAPKIIAAAIRLKNVGPIGDQMADIIDPKQDEMHPEQVKQQIGQMQQQMQQLQQALQQATEELRTKKLELESREHIAEMEIASKEKIAGASDAQKAADREVKIAVAELGAKVERLQLFYEERARVGSQQHDAAHEVGMAALAQRHTIEQGQQSAQIDSDMAAQGHQNTLEQGAQAAALAPQPEVGA